VIGTGWCGGIRAETLSRSALVDKLHICEIRPDRLAEVKALTKAASAIKSATERAGTDGCTASMPGKRTIFATGTKSRNGA